MALRLPPLPLSRLVSPPDVIFGAGSLSVLKLLDASRPAVFVRQPAVRDRLQKLLPDTAVILTPSWTGEPTLEGVQDSIRDLEATMPDWIVAIGGGSVIDGARLAWLSYECPHLDLAARGRAVLVPRLRSRARFCAAPTTAGSGAEASPAVTFQQRGRIGKAAIASVELIPDLVVLDPRLTIDLPTPITTACALDALAHAIEGYSSAMLNPLVDGLAVDCIRAIKQFLPEAAASRATEAVRGELLMAAHRGGVVQAHRIPGLSHAIAHQLGSLGISHGLANAILLPHVIRRNAQDAGTNAKYCELARRSGIGETADDLASFVDQSRAAAGLPSTISSAINSNGPDRAALVESALEDPCARANPVPVDSHIVTELLEGAW
jgi:alcohol dehydrogenase